MKIRELKPMVGGTLISIWPPSWASSYGRGRTLAVGEEGVLKSVRRLDKRLSLTVEYDGREHVGSLEWTPPPAPNDVEKVLEASIGKIGPRGSTLSGH